MNRERAKELLPVIQAFADGKDIQRFDKSIINNWFDVDNVTGVGEYRIKPEPREFNVMVMGSGYIRDPSDSGNGYLGEKIKVREVL